MAIVVPCVVPVPISNTSVPSSIPNLTSVAFPSKTNIVSSAPASPIVSFGVVPPITGLCENVTTPDDAIAIASESLAEPIVPSSGTVKFA